MTLYQALIDAGCEIGNHESDLYVKRSDVADATIRAYEREFGNVSKSYFRSQIDGEIWIDLPFMYVPFWEAKRR